MRWFTAGNRRQGLRPRMWVGLGVGLVLGLLSARAPAVVNPVTLIQRQVIKPNMLIVLDTSTSMLFAPGSKEYDANEVGMDCDNGVSCRQLGTAGRCYLAGTGAMGAGVGKDYTSCHSNAECQTGYCSDNKPTTCNQDSNCSTTCRGFCANNNSTACTRDSDCGTGNHCRGICAEDWSTPKCTSDSQCSATAFCMTFPNDACVATTSLSGSKVCQFGQQRCRLDSDCGTGDTCVAASSRLTVAKRVVGNIVSSYYNTVNFGLMTFYQDGYYPYFKVSGAVTTASATEFFTKDLLASLSCWTKAAGASGTCTVNGQSYTKRTTLDSRYRVKTGKTSFTEADAAYCGLWCGVTGGTGYYRGSYYTRSEPQGTLVNASCSAATDCAAPDNDCCDGVCCRTETTYQGRSKVVSGANYIYWNPPADRSNENNVFNDVHGPKPIAAGDTTSVLPCLATMGGRADTTVAPFMDTTDNAAKAQAMTAAIMGKMAKTSMGGLAAEGFTPTGCALSFNGSTASSSSNNALAYMQAVKASDTMPCRSNYVLLVTDGNPTRTYDAACDDAKCAAADPTAAGCTCWAVKAAQQLKNNGIKTYVVGFSNSVVNAYGQATMNNIARAGGSAAAYFAVREDELSDAITSAIYDAAKGSYSTSPASSSSSLQTTTGTQFGTMLLDTRVDFPGWKGQLFAYETSSGSPVLAWSASTVAFDYGCAPPLPSTCDVTQKTYYSSTARKDEWRRRNVWTSNGTTMVKIDVNTGTGAITNAATLATLGLGADAAEADRVARWMLGDPALANPAVLGAIINSTPIDVGPPGGSLLPGGKEFHDAYAGRASLVYVGASDGMLHAFFTKDVTIGGTLYKGGSEAFAYIPQTMLAVQAKLYAQDGQLPAPRDHVYGLANSAKVKNLCTASCDGLGTPVWKTELVMAYGFGGTEAFALDITDPFDSAGPKSGTGSPPASLMWNTQYLAASTSSAYDNDLGLTTSVPAFFYGKGASKDDFRLLFGSYSPDTTTGVMGKVMVSSSAKTGALLDSVTITPGGTACTQPLGLLSDVATARNYNASEESQILAAYFGDTWGNLYRYVPTVSGPSNYTGNTGALTTVQAFGCQQPIHYVPAVVQMDRDNAYNGAGQIYLVQVTNSALDDDTKSFPASQMIIRRDIGNTTGGTVTADATWTNITLTAGTNLCGVSNAAGTACNTIMPAGARPNATPLAVLRSDGQGFDIISTWYLPAVNGCTDGVTYLNILEVNVNGTYSLRYAAQLASEPVTSTVFVGGKLMFAAQSGVTDLSSMLPAAIKFNATGTGTLGVLPERFRRLGWTELP
jgi:hypothetical protein